MEYLDICDNDGNLIGEKRSKKEVHEQGLWHKSVHVWVVNSKREILLQKRSPFVENHPNKWDISAAGHVSAGEDFIASAQRETEEEIGIIAKPEDFVLIGTAKQESERPGYINREINPVYVVTTNKGLSEMKKQHEEVAEIKFISYSNFKKMIKEKDQDILQHPAEYEILFSYLDNKWK